MKTGTFGVVREENEKLLDLSGWGVIEVIERLLWEAVIDHMIDGAFDDRKYECEFCARREAGIVIQGADKFRLDVLVWVKDYRQTKIGEHTKLPCTSSWGNISTQSSSRIVYNKMVFEPDFNLWKRVE